MTQDDIIRMAREAGFAERNHHSEILVRHSNGSWVDVEAPLWKFATLVAAAEREACVQICIEQACKYQYPSHAGAALTVCADAIRARGAQ